MKFFFLILLLAYSLVCFVVYIFQRSLIYFPTQYTKIDGFDEITFKIDSIKLQGWIINKGKEDALIYYGGNAENIEQNIHLFQKLFSDKTIYFVNYRAYGKSEGHPSEENLFNDALEIYNKIEKKHSAISLVGRSLGSGVACYVASQKKVENLVLITPYDSILNVAKESYKFLPVSFLLKDRFESIKYAPKIKSKTMIIYGGKDQVINSKRTENLIKAFKEDQLSILLIPDANHNEISLFEEYNYNLRDFIL